MHRSSILCAFVLAALKPHKKKRARPGGVSFRGAGPTSDQRFLGSGLSYGCVGAFDCAPRRDCPA
jgi:hypothetical protein